MKPVELVLLMRDKTRQALTDAGRNLDGLTQDYEELICAIRDSEAAMQQSSRTAEQAASGYSGLQSVLMKIGGTTALIGLGKEIIRVRSEFQNTEASFRVFLGSAEKASAFMKELQSYSFNNVFEFKDLTQQASRLLAYQNSVSDIIPIIDKLSNIAAGANVPLEQLVDLYNKAKSQGKLLMLDIQQWQRAGVPVIQELAKQMNTTEAAIGDMVSAGKVGFEEINAVLNKITSSGGMFSGMMEEKMKTLGDSVGLLQDSITAMFNEIGEKSQDFLRDGILFANTLVENYEKIGKVLIALIATYGTYRTALAVDAVVRHVRELGSLAEAIRRTEIAQKLLNATILKNPYVLAASVVIGLVTAVWALYDGTNAQAESLKRLKSLQDDFNKSVETEKIQIDILFGRLKAAKEGTDEYQKAKDNIISKYGSYLDGLNEEIKTLKNVEAAYRAVSEAALQAAKDRAVEKGTQEAVDAYTQTWGKNISKIRDKFIEEFDEAKGTLLLDGLKESLSKGTDIPDEIKKAIDKFTTTPYSARVQINPINNAGVTSNPVDRLISEIRDSKKALDEEVKSINQIYGSISGPKDPGKKDPVFSKISDEIKDATDNVNRFKKELEDLRSGKTQPKKEGETVLSLIEAKTKELEEAEKALAVLTGKTGKENRAGSPADKAQKDAQEQADLLVKMADNEAKAELDRRQNKSDNEQKLLDIEQDGWDKRQKQIKLNHEKELLAIDKHARELIEKQREAERLAWKQSGGKGVFVPTVTSEEKLPQELQNEINTRRETADKTRAHADKALTDELVKQYQTYSEKRLEIEEKFNKDLAALKAANEDGKYDLNIEELKRQMTEALATLDNEFSGIKTAVEQLFDDMSQKAVGDMRHIASEAQAMIKFIADGEWDAEKAVRFGIKTEAQFKQLNAEWAKSPGKLDAVRRAVRELNNEADRSDTAFGKMSAGLQKIFDSKGQNDLKSGLDTLADGLRSVTEAGNLFADSLRNIGELAGSDIFSSIADGLSQVMNVADSTMRGARAGAAFGPVGAAIGAGLGSELLTRPKSNCRDFKN